MGKNNNDLHDTYIVPERAFHAVLVTFQAVVKFDRRVLHSASVTINQVHELTQLPGQLLLTHSIITEYSDWLGNARCT